MKGPSTGEGAVLLQRASPFPLALGQQAKAQRAALCTGGTVGFCLFFPFPGASPSLGSATSPDPSEARPTWP